MCNGPSAIARILRVINPAIARILRVIKTHQRDAGGSWGIKASAIARILPLYAIARILRVINPPARHWRKPRLKPHQRDAGGSWGD